MVYEDADSIYVVGVSAGEASEVAVDARRLRNEPCSWSAGRRGSDVTDPEVIAADDLYVLALQVWELPSLACGCSHEGCPLSLVSEF